MKKILNSVMAISMAMMAMVSNAQDEPWNKKLTDSQQKVCDLLFDDGCDKSLANRIEWYNNTKTVIEQEYGKGNVASAFKEMADYAQGQQEGTTASIMKGLYLESRMDIYYEMEAYSNIITEADPKMKKAHQNEMEAWIELENAISSMNYTMMFSEFCGSMYGIQHNANCQALIYFRSKLYCDDVYNMKNCENYKATTNISAAISSYERNVEYFINYGLSFSGQEDDDYDANEAYKQEYTQLFEKFKPVLNRWVEARAQVAKLLGKNSSFYDLSTERLIRNLPTPINEKDY